jgi:hypothetical protein
LKEGRIVCCHLPESFYASYYKESYLRNHHEYEYADSLVGKEIFAESAAGLGRGLRGLRGPVAGAASRAWGFLRPRREAAGEAAG